MLPNLLASARVAVCVLFAVVVSASVASADDWTVVVDYGAEAKAGREARWNQALDVTDALRDAGHVVRLIALGAKGDDKWKSADLYKALKAGSRAEALERFEAQADAPGYRFQAPLDVDHALAAALDRHDGDEPFTVLLVGPFAGTAARAEAPDAEDGADTAGDEESKDADEAEATPDEPAPSPWDADAPDGSRVLLLGAVDADVAAVLEARTGWVGAGWLVLGYGDAWVETEPWSPLGAREGALPDRRLVAHVAWSAKAVALAQPGSAAMPRTLLVTGAAGDDVAHAADGARRATLGRAGGGVRTATLSFAERADLGAAVIRVGALPDPVDVAWTTLLPDARLWTPDGDPPAALDFADTEARTPRRALLRIVRTRTGPAPRWTVRVETKSGVAVPGLAVTVDAEVPTSADLGSTNVHVALAPPAAVPFDEGGVIRLSAEGIARVLEVPFHASAPAGIVALEHVGPDVGPLALPAGAEDPRATLEVVSGNGNAPARVEVLATSSSGSVRGRLRLANGLEQTIVPEVPFEVPVDEPFELGLSLADRGAWRTLGEGQVQLRLAERRGVETSGEVVLAFRPRTPAIRIDGGDATYRVEDGRVVSTAPVRLRLDADGGDGDWLLARLAVPPEVSGDGTWRAVPLEPGVWTVERDGEWDGERPGPFDDVVAQRTVIVTWADGGAPGEVRVEVVVPARWGARGWWFVGLAGAALLLAVFTFLQLRVPGVSGTLLYTVDGMTGAVGRLDLAPVGRRATVLYADERGRLGLGKAARGGDAVGVVRPTRVGGMLEVPGEDGVPERRLLVDGLALRAGRHAFRYVTGTPDEAGSELALVDVPDLLGPEFDLEPSEDVSA